MRMMGGKNPVGRIPVGAGTGREAGATGMLEVIRLMVTGRLMAPFGAAGAIRHLETGYARGKIIVNVA